MTTKTSDKASGRTNPDNAQGTSSNVLVGTRMFAGSVKPNTVSRGGGRKANALNEAVLGSLNFMLGELQQNKPGNAWDVYKGTQATRKRDLVGTVDKWIKAQELSGVIVKVHYQACEGFKISNAADDNDKPVEVLVSMELETPQTKNGEPVAAK